MGNTRRICEQHYINKLVTAQEGKTWFDIKPDKGNVIPMQVGHDVNGDKECGDAGLEQTPATAQP
jgi:hypothetical protein